jgi:Mn2+/Fe2+ NRAMP family transporter
MAALLAAIFTAPSHRRITSAVVTALFVLIALLAYRHYRTTENIVEVLVGIGVSIWFTFVFWRSEGDTQEAGPKPVSED